jgi:hypothetical protein
LVVNEFKTLNGGPAVIASLGFDEDAVAGNLLAMVSLFVV